MTEEDDGLYVLPDKRVIIDGDRFVAFLRDRGDKTYHWILETDRGAFILLGLAALRRMAFLGLIGFFVPYSLLFLWNWRAYHVVVITITGAVLLLCIAKGLFPPGRARFMNPARRVGSAQRWSDWMSAKYLTVAAGCWGALMFAPGGVIRDKFEGDDRSYLAPLEFLSFQIARVFTLDVIEIAGWDWSAIETGSRVSSAATVGLNILISLGALKLLTVALREAETRHETVIGDTFAIYWMLSREPVLGRKWVRVCRVVSDEEEDRALAAYEFKLAYESTLIPVSADPVLAEPPLF